jgi:hypothetical protein
MAKADAALSFSREAITMVSIVDGDPDAALRQQLVQRGVEIVPVQRSR